jgi:hypothetical protein
MLAAIIFAMPLNFLDMRFLLDALTLELIGAEQVALQ